MTGEIDIRDTTNPRVQRAKQRHDAYDSARAAGGIVVSLATAAFGVWYAFAHNLAIGAVIFFVGAPVVGMLFAFLVMSVLAMPIAGRDGLAYGRAYTRYHHGPS